MKRETELTRRILQSRNGQRIIDFVAPIYNDGETALWLFESVGQILDDISENINSLYRQVTPEKATWTLPYWETEYNIIPESYWNEEERRAAVIAKIKYVAPVNPAKIEQFASAAMGVPCKIVENIGENTFRIVINGWSESFPRLKQIINEAKPAHLIWNVHAEIPPIIFIERPGGIFEKNLRFKTFVNYWSCYCFNGKRRFDGSIDFSFKRGGLNFVGAYIRMKAVLRHWFFPSRLKMKSLRISNQERIPLNIGIGRTVFDNMGEFIRLNGEQQLEGSWFLWQRARSAIFQNFCIRAAAREEPSVFFLIQSKFRIIHYSPNYLKQSYYKTGVLKFAPITETIISRTQIKHSQREINQAPLLWNAVFSFFRLKNKDNIFLSQIWRMSTIEKQSFSFRRFDFLIHYLESTGSGDLRLSAGVFPITDAFEKISSKLHWRVETPKQYLILSPVRFNIQTKISRFISKIKVQKFYFSPYPFHNRNEIGNVYLTMVEPSRADGEDSFDGTLAFDGKAVPKTEMI